MPDLPWYLRFFREEYLLFDDHTDTAAEIDFLLDLLAPEKTTRVLDVGCGYGRHAVPLAGACAVTGVDLSPVLLAEAARSAAGAAVKLPLVRGDMARLPFRPAFHAALSLFTSIGYFPNDDQNFAVLQGVADVLLPGGRFLLETVNREFVLRRSIPHQVYRPRGCLLVEERSFNPITGRSEVDVTLVRGATQTHLHHSVRLYTFTELDMLLSAAGLRTVDVWGDYAGNPYTADSPHTIVLSRKP